LARRGHQWGGPRASAAAIAALATVGATASAAPRAVRVVLDGRPMDRQAGSAGAWPFSSAFDSSALPPGRHDLLLSVTGGGAEPSIFHATLRYHLPPDPSAKEVVHKALEIQRRYRAVPHARLARAGGRSLLAYLAPKEADRLSAADRRLSRSAMAIVRLTVTARQALRFVRITDPLPAGAAAVRVPGRSAWHQAESPDAVILDVPDLPPGRHEFAYALRPRVEGTFNVPPPTVEAVQQPDIRARGTAAVVDIQ
ncbi:MAG: hypothetical protein FJZ01_20870, partial [Candidatus Sericytochromatia bacterium]|nr:hypothetical protein [Candidatus Tanganyikabacteria bacterium]